MSATFTVALNTSVENGAQTLHTRWGESSRAGGFPVGPNRLDLAEFGDRYAVCGGAVYYNGVPRHCSGPALLVLHCASLALCRVSGYVGDQAVSLPLQWATHSTARATPFVSGAYSTALYQSGDSMWLSLVPQGSNSVHVVHRPDKVTVVIRQGATDSDDNLSVVVAIGLALCFSLWSRKPRKASGGAYRWLEADLIFAPATLSLGRLTPDPPTGCSICGGNTACSWVCGTPASSYLWALIGIALPIVSVYVLSSRLPPLAPYACCRKLVFTVVEVLLLVMSVAHIPQARVGLKASDLAHFCVGAGVLAIVGRLLYSRPRDRILTYLFSAVAFAHAAASLVRPLVQTHPAMPIGSWSEIAACTTSISLAFVATGTYVGQTQSLII